MPYKSHYQSIFWARGVFFFQKLPEVCIRIRTSNSSPEIILHVMKIMVQSHIFVTAADNILIVMDEWGI